jgi:5-aminolevulinate synthase
MNGNLAPIKEICAIAKKYNALTYLDEVHAVGVYGNQGGGYAQELGVADQIDVIQSGFGKTVGVMGGYIAGTTELVDFVRTFSPGFIFTTSMLPSIAEGARASISHMMTCNKERKLLLKNVTYLKAQLRLANVPFLDSGSHIVPVIVGDAIECKRMTDYLMKEHAIYVQPIVYPTVPVGTERIRLTPTSNHTFEMVDQLVLGLTEFWSQKGQLRAA